MARGGMSKNPFGGNNSLNGLDDDIMLALAKGFITSERALSLRIIKMSCRDYLFFGLGKNGITPERFIEAYAYIFKSDSQKPGLSENTKAKCFDTHFYEAGFGSGMTVEQFRERLAKKREQILKANEKQVLTYMEEYRAEEWKRLLPEQRQGKHAFPRDGYVCTLTAPDDVKRLAELYLFGRHIPVVQEPVGKIEVNYKTYLF